jgi:tungstate transport system substrate-binding protein|tara:strand:- start:1203 stop:2189 length:987 start_codon:yes stop_codon:yes gene_type:complete
MNIKSNHFLLIFIILGGLIGGYYIISSLVTQETDRTNLIISTTTSIYDTGLLDVIEIDFEAKYAIDILFIPVGTGQAIVHGQRGDSDLILVHAPIREYDFLVEDYGVARKIIAYNFFIIIGSPDDPAGVKDGDIIDAMKNIADSGRRGESVWISRGDDSGTHTREKSLWKEAGFEVTSLVNEPWYLEAGSGMLSTLRLANEKGAYTLSDTGTFLKFNAGTPIELEILVDQTKELINVYSAIAVNPDLIEWVNFEGAIQFMEYLISEDTQDLIANFGGDIFEKALFSPAVDMLKSSSDENETQWIMDIAFLNGFECPPQYRAGQDQLYD